MPAAIACHWDKELATVGPCDAKECTQQMHKAGTHSQPYWGPALPTNTPSVVSHVKRNVHAAHTGETTGAYSSGGQEGVCCWTP